MAKLNATRNEDILHHFIGSLDLELRKYSQHLPFDVSVLSYSPRLNIGLIDKKTRQVISLDHAMQLLSEVPDDPHFYPEEEN